MGGLVGLVAGLLGAFIGVIGAVFGAIFGAIGGVLGAFDWFAFPHIHISGLGFLLIVAIIFAVVMMSRSGKKR